MKTPMKRILKKLTMIGAATILALLFCIFLALSALADAEKPVAKINAVSLGLEDRVCLLFRAAVTDLEDYMDENGYDDYAVRLQVGTTPPSGSEWEHTVLSAYREEANDVYFFSYNGQKPMQMTESVYARVELWLDGDDEEYIYSDVVRYSVLDYAHDTIDSTMVLTEGGSTLGEMVQKILEYGAMSQTYFGYKTDRLPTDEYYFVRVENGRFSDGVNTAIAFRGDTVTLTADEAPAGGCFDHWEDENGQIVSTQATATLSPSADTVYTAVFWSEAGISLDLAFTDLDGTTCALSGLGSCADTAIVIPNRAPNGKWVTKISANAFFGSDITSVCIPSSVTTIESGAFDGCAFLATITVEAGNPSFTASDFLFLSVEGGSFDGGLSSKIVLAGESVSITAEVPVGATFDHWEDANETFVSDQSTALVTPTANTTYIAVVELPQVSSGLSFQNLSSTTCALSGMGTCTDTDLLIPNVSPDGKTVVRINANALAGNTNLTSVLIPQSVTEIGYKAFEGCTSLTAFYVEEGNSSFMTDRDMLLTYDGTTILRYPPARTGTALALPSAILELADGSFADAKNLSTITMNESIERIGAYAFARSGIGSVKIKATVTEIGEYAFDHCNKLTSVSVESGNTVYKSTTYAIFTIDNTTLIRAKNYSSMVSFPTGLTTFAPGSFSGCDKMTTLTMPKTVTTIGERAFEDCIKLSTFSIASAVERIEDYAFYGCNSSGFTSLTIPASVTYIGNSAFENCTNLATVKVNGEPSYVGANVLRGTAVTFNPFDHEHAFTNYVKYSDASCASGTVYTYQCACGLKSDERIVTSSAVAHNYSGSICTVCGQERMNTSYDSYLVLPVGRGNYYGMYDPSSSDYSSMDDANIIYYTDFTSSDYEEYLQKLRNAGLTEGETYTLGSNRYAFFHHSQYTLYASYLEGEQALRVYVGMPNDVNPSKGAVADAGLVTPSIWQININNKAAESNGGMSYVIQLTDGKFLVVDGGYETAEDAKSIYDILVANKPSSHSKPIVAGWFLTHMHIDHVGAFRKFADTYSYRIGVTIEAFYYNFSYQNVKDIWPSNSQTWENKMSARFPSATRYRKLHSGMNFYFSGAQVKILCTHEDVYPLAFNSGNDTSMVFQVIIGGQKILFLGDAEYGENDRMLNLGKSVMKSDILQYAHHGYDYQCRTNLYELIEPATVLWPMPIVNYQSTSYGECFRPRYLNKSENSWIRSATCVKKIIVMEEGTTRLMLPYTPTGARNADYVTLYNNIKKTLK